MIIDNKDEIIKAIDKIGDDLEQILIRAGLRIEAAVKDQITKEGLVDTGRFRASIHTTHPNKYKIIVQDGVPYGIYHEIGTGIYGPRRDYIRPKRARALRFEVKEAKLTKAGRYKGLNRRVVYAKKVKGIQPKRPFLKALHNLAEILKQEIEKLK